MHPFVCVAEPHYGICHDMVCVWLHWITISNNYPQIIIATKPQPLFDANQMRSRHLNRDSTIISSAFAMIFAEVCSPNLYIRALQESNNFSSYQQEKHWLITIKICVEEQDIVERPIVVPNYNMPKGYYKS